MGRGILFELGNQFIYARELFTRAPELFISFLERCDRDIVWISLFSGSGWNSFGAPCPSKPRPLYDHGAIAGGSIS